MKFIFILFYLVCVLYKIQCNNNSNSNASLSKSKNEKFSNTNQKSLTAASTKATIRLKFKSLINIGLGFITNKNKNVNVEMLKVNERFQGYPIVTADTKTEIGKGPILFTGWNKYFSIKILAKSGSDSGMKSFIINKSYEIEQSIEYKNNHKDADNQLFIPDKDQFYFILTQEYLSIVSSRFNELAKTVDTIEIANLFDIKIDQSSKEVKGGVEDLGNFQEGFCFLIRGKKKSTNSPDSADGESGFTNYKWVVCSENYESKCELMKKLMALRLKLQAECEKKRGTSATSKIKLLNQPMLPTNTTETSRWINLQNWSSCTLACGGGTQTLQRYCLKIPNGPECEGDAIITRPCNTHPCTNVTDEVIDSQLLPTEIRIIPVSLRPQRYIKCEVKEEDLDIIRYDIGNLRIPPRIPSRVIMNNQTLTIYEAGTLDSFIASYKLKEIKILEIFAEDKKCLKLGFSKNKFSVMCIICTDTSPEDPEKRIKNWIEDIKEFTNECNLSQEDSLRKQGISDEDPRLLKLKKQLETEDIKKKLARLKDLQKKKSEAQNEKTLKMAQLIALRTLNKERKYEQRLEDEEMMREQKEDEDIKNEYLCEERKKMNLLKAIIQKDEAQNKHDLELKEKLREIEEDIKNKVIQNRKRALRKINLLRLSHERKKMKLRQQISDVRRALTQNILYAEKIGDAKKCVNSILQNKYEEYCTANFSTNPITFMDCKNKDNFCFICCENEFGDMHLNEREECNYSCDKIYEENKNSDEDSNNGLIGKWKS